MMATASLQPIVRSRSLRAQHRDWQRDGYDGHNRRSGLTPLSRLRGRYAPPHAPLARLVRARVDAARVIPSPSV